MKRMPTVRKYPETVGFSRVASRSECRWEESQRRESSTGLCDRVRRAYQTSESVGLAAARS
jgi:hypothetical protein